MDAPPILSKKKNLRFAATLNLLVPGAGQIYLGQYLFGFLLATVFLICFVGTFVIFIRGYIQYLQSATGGDILSSGALDQLGAIFHIRWLLALLAIAIVIFGVSMASLAVTSRNANGDPTPGP
jgi:hypothetical protein